MTRVPSDQVRTVRGDIADGSLGATLCHEHLSLHMPPPFSEDYVLDDIGIVSYEMARAKKAGVRTIVDCGTQEHRRDPEFLTKLSESTGMNVIACTGFYTEATYSGFVRNGSIDDLAEFMNREITEGIGNTNIRAGAIGELATAAEGPTALEEKVLRAASSVQKETGVAILTHTAEGRGAVEQLEVLLDAGAEAGRVLVGHLDCTDDISVFEEIARRGAFVGLDRVGALVFKTDEHRAKLVADLVGQGWTRQIILSSDAAGRHRFEPRGGLGYSQVPAGFRPMLTQQGLKDAVITQILVDNPRRLLSA
jgi:phosphotriesterase-related protein